MAHALPSASLLENVAVQRDRDRAERGPGPVPAAPGASRRRPRKAERGRPGGRVLRRDPPQPRPGAALGASGTNRALLMLAGDDVRRVLEGSPEPFASDPEAKRRGMGHFQPDALTISRGELWENRRRFTEAVLDTPSPCTGWPNASSRWRARRQRRCCSTSRGWRRRARLGGVPPRFPADHPAGRARRRGARRRGGDRAAGRAHVGGQRAAGASAPRARAVHGQGPRVRRRGRAGQPGRPVRRGAVGRPRRGWRARSRTGCSRCRTRSRQTRFRALALIASHPRQRARWRRSWRAPEGGDAGGRGRTRVPASVPPGGDAAVADHAAAVTRDARGLDWNGAAVPAGTQVLIFNTFHHRDRERDDYADRFAPEAWTKGAARGGLGLQPFQPRSAGMPRRGPRALVGSAVLARLLTQAEPRLLEPKLDPERPLPHMLDSSACAFPYERPR